MADKLLEHRLEVLAGGTQRLLSVRLNVHFGAGTAEKFCIPIV
jgi:hypothetical protein